MFAFHFVLSRQLGLARYGALYTVISLATFIAVLGGILTIVVARLVAEHRANPDQLGSLCGSSVKRSAQIGLGAFIVLLASAFPIAQFLRVSELSVLAFLALFAGGQIALAGFRGVLQGLQQFQRLAWTLIIEAFVLTSLAIVLAVFGFGLSTAIGAYAIGTLVAGAYALAAVRKSVRFRFTGAGLPFQSIARLSFCAALSTAAIAAL